MTVSGAMAQTKPAPKGKAAAVAKPSGDAVAGLAAYTMRCKVCHAEGGVGGGIGPDLRGVYGRASATGPFTRYSANMKALNVVWTEANLDIYLAGPTKMVPGTTMVLPPLQPTDRKNLIAYVATLKK